MKPGSVIVKLRRGTIIGVGEFYPHPEHEYAMEDRFNNERSPDEIANLISFGTLNLTDNDYIKLRDRSQRLGAHGETLRMWLLPADTPYKGHPHSLMEADGTIQFSNHATLEEYEARTGYTFRLVTDEELDALDHEFEESKKTPPSPISEERWHEMLETLPPCRWHHHNGVELFHMSEHLFGSLVDWFARVGNQYFEFTDSCKTPSENLSNLVRKAAL